MVSFQSFCDLKTFNKPSFLFLSLQFQFVNSYLSLFYIGFYLKDMERLKEVSNISLSALWIFFSIIILLFQLLIRLPTSVTAAVSRPHTVCSLCLHALTL